MFAVGATNGGSKADKDRGSRNRIWSVGTLGRRRVPVQASAGSTSGTSREQTVPDGSCGNAGNSPVSSVVGASAEADGHNRAHTSLAEPASYASLGIPDT